MAREWNVGLQLHIPDSVVQAMRLPEERMAQELLVELAPTLYAQGSLTSDKARELAGIGRPAFSQLLGQCGIPHHYGPEELAKDPRHARHQ